MRVSWLFSVSVAVFSYTTVSAVESNDKGVFTGNLVELAASNENFSTLVSLLQATGLDLALVGDGPFTVFAPTNDAFNSLSADVLEYLGNNQAELTKVLLYHVVGDILLATDLKDGGLTTLEGEDVRIDTSGPTVNEANIILTNILAENGVAHAIDSVLVPSSVLLPVCPEICCCKCCGKCTGHELGFLGCNCICNEK